MKISEIGISNEGDAYFSKCVDINPGLIAPLCLSIK